MAGNKVERDELKRVHERIDDLQENRLQDLKDTNECLTKIKRSIASIESSLEQQKETLGKLSSKTDELADKRKDWDSVIDEKIEKHVAECPASDIVDLQRDGFIGVRRTTSEDRMDEVLMRVKKFGRKHPAVTGGGGAATVIALIKIGSWVLEVFG